LVDLKTPDKCAFEFNSMVSGNKNLTQDKFSHEKFQISSNSVEKFRLQKKANTHQQKIISSTQNKTQQVVLSDNKKQSINAHLFKKMILKNQVATTFSDEK